MKKLISIIIPVYNVEKYIGRCIESCIKQDLSCSDYEVIIINDGTPDNSMSIVDAYVVKYPDLIKVYSQSNAGLSAARNLGLFKAKGDYIWFVDSDDWIKYNCLREIVNFLNNSVPDLLQIQYRLVYDDSSKNIDVPFYKQSDILSGKEVILRGGLPAPAQFTIYRRLFLLDNNLIFYPGIYHEDSEFKPRAAYLATSVASYPVICYNYYQRVSGSIMSSFRLKNAIDIITVMISIHDFSVNFDKPLYAAFGSFISTNMNSLLIGMRSLPEGEQKEIIRMLSNNKFLFNRMFASPRLKYRLEGLIFSLNIRVGLLFHAFLR